MARDKTFNFRITASGIDQLKRDLEALGPAGQRAFEQLRQSSPSLENALGRAQADAAKARAGLEELGRAGKAAGDQVTSSLQNAAQQLGPVGSVLAGIGGGATAAAGATVALGAATLKLAQASDAYALLQARIKLVTGSAGEARDTMQQLFGVAQAGGARFDDTVGAFQRLALAAKDIGVSTGDVVSLTDAVQKLGRLGGSTGSELQAGMQQFAQSLASGRLQGDELRSVMENMPLLARAIADGLGVAVGQLKEMGANGELTAQRIFPAMLSQLGKINEQFAGLPQTVEQSVQRIRNEFEGLVADIGKAANASPFWSWYLNDYVGGALRGTRRLFAAPSPSDEIAAIDAEIARTERLPGVTAENASLKALRARRAPLAAAVQDDAFAATAAAGEKNAALLDRQNAAMATLRSQVEAVVAARRQEAEILSLSAEAQKVAAAREKAELDVLKAGGVNTRQELLGLEQAKVDLLTVQATLAADEAEKKVRIEAATRRATEAEKERAAAAKEAAKNIAEQAAQQDKDRAAAAKRGAEIIAQDAKRQRSLAEYITGLENAASAEALSSTEKEVQLALIEAQNKLIDEQGHKLRDLTETEKQRVTHAVRQKAALEEQRKAAEDFARDVQRTTDRVLDNISDAGADVIFDRWKGKSADLWGTFKDYAMRAIAGLASEGVTNLLFRPLVGAAVRSAPALFGIGGGGGFGGPGLISGFGGGTFNPDGSQQTGGPGFTDFLGFGSNLLPSSFTSSITGGIDAFGASAFGLGAGAYSAAAAQAAASTYGISAGQAAALSNSGALGSTASLSGILGAAGLGFAGGSLLASLTGGNAMGGGIGGGIGAGAGFLLGGPVGALIGGVGGSLLGGLFGGGKKKRPIVSGSTAIGVDASGRLSVGGTSASNADPNVTLGQAQQVVASMNQLLERYDLIATRGTSVGQGIAPGPASAEGAINQLFHDRSITSDNAVMAAILKNTVNRTIESVAADLDFGLLFRSFAELQRPANALRDSFEALSKQFDAVAEKAPALGLSVESLRSGSAANFNQDIERAILGFTNPLELALDDYEDAAAARLDYARKIGADLVEVERLNMLERQRIVQQSGLDLNGWLQNQLLGGTSALTGLGKLSEAQAQLAAAQASNDNNRVLQLADLIAGLYTQLYGGTAAAAEGIASLRGNIAGYGKSLGLPGFNFGGSFIVGPGNTGWGGVDRTLVQFRANEGERVTVSPPGSGGASSADIGELALILTQLKGEVTRLRQVSEAQAQEIRALRAQGDLQINAALRRNAAGSLRVV